MAGRKRLREERSDASAMALPEVSGSSVSTPSLREKMAGTPDGPEPRRKRATKRNAKAVSVGSTLRLTVLLPNRTIVRLEMNREQPMSLRQLLGKVEQQQSKDGLYPIDWQGELWLQDHIHGDVPEIRSDECLASLCKCPQTDRTLLLVDGNIDAEYGGNEMWDITPQPAIITRLPQGYDLATALADQVDNALQAVWSNVHGTRFISVDIEPDKITIFDNGKGMTADDGPNSIAKWGTLGSSTHRDVHHEAMEGSEFKPPYMKPWLGKYGAGGVSSAFFMGGSGVVFSKTETETMVGSLILNPTALDQRSKQQPDQRFWKVPGVLRHMTKEEKEKAPHGSFTKVEITKLRKHYSKTAHGDRKEEDIISNELAVKQMLKDIYAPYIQCDDVETSRTTFPVIFQVNGQNLTEVEGGEVTVSNKYSCPAEEFVVDLHFKMDPDAYSAQPLTGVKPKDEAHASLRCQYFPNTKGKEALQSVLDEVGHIRSGETFQSMARVTVRWLGRLLPQTKWPLLPFMEVNPRRSRDGIRPQWAKRVKACLYTDAGFFPNQAKTELDRDHPFTVAARNLGATDQELSKASISGLGVKVYVSRNGKSLTQEKLVKEYMAWLKARHETFDDEVIVGKNDVPVYVFRHKGLDDWCASTDCSAGVFQFHNHMKGATSDWDVTSTPLRIKLQKGLCGLKRDLYATLEFFFHSGTDEEHGEVGMVCRPMDVQDTNGSRIVLDGQEMVFLLGKSRVFPVSALISVKTVCISEQQWQRKEEENTSKAPSSIALLGFEECQRLGINEAFPVEEDTVHAGYVLPTQFLAVVRVKRGIGTSKQASICAEPMELEMRVAFSASGNGEMKQLCAVTCKAATVANVKGIYRFNLKDTGFAVSLEKEGNYVFTFSLVSDRFKEVADKECTIKVKAAEQTAQWRISLNSKSSERARPTFRLAFSTIHVILELRFGCIKTARPLSDVVELLSRLDEIASSSFLLRKLDAFGNVQTFKDQEEVADLPLGVQVLAPGGNGLGIRAVRKVVSLTKDKKCALIKDLLFCGGDLSLIEPQFEAILRFRLAELKLEDVSIQVLPGRLKSMELKHSQPDLSNACFKPEDVIRELTLQGRDGAGNKSDQRQRVVVELDGLEFLSGQEKERTFHLGNDGTLDLGGNFKITSAYGASGSVTIMTEERTQLIKLQFRVAVRRLQFTSQVPDTCFLGQSLCGLVVEVVDEGGTVDKTMDGGLHNLEVDWNNDSVYPLRSGSCALPPIVLPSVVGPWHGDIRHAAFPTLRIGIEVTVELDIAVRLGAKPGYKDVITTQCGDSCSVEFVPVTESGQQGRLQQDVIARLTMDTKLLNLEHFQKTPGQLNLEDFHIRSLYDEGSTGYAASFKMTGPAGIYVVTLTDSIGNVSGENGVSWHVRLRPGRPHKLSAFLPKPGYEAHYAELEPLSRLGVPRFKALQSFVVTLFDASGNVCDTHEECFLRMDAQDCPNWGSHSEEVKEGRAIFESFHVDADIGTYVICIKPSNPSVCLASASFVVDVTAGNYPSSIWLRDPTPLNVTHNGKDVQYLPMMAVIVEAADGQKLEGRFPLGLTISSGSKAQGTSDHHYFGELAQPIQTGGQFLSQMTFGRVPLPFQAGKYRLTFSIESAEQTPGVEPIILPLIVHHGPPTGMGTSHDEHKLIVTILDRHGNRCKRVSGLEITAQPVGRLQESVAVVERGCATFDDLPFHITEPKLQLQIFIRKQESFQISCPQLVITVVRNLPRAIQELSEKIQQMQQQRREAQHAIDTRVGELRLIQENIATIEGNLKMVQEKHERLSLEYQSDYAVLGREKEEPGRTMEDVHLDLRRNKGRKGYGAALALIEARYRNNFLSPHGGNPVAAEVLGLVVTLGRVENKALNSILSEFIGTSMVNLVCKTLRAEKALEAYNNGQVDQQRGLAAFAKSRGYNMGGRYTVVTLEMLTPFTRRDHQDNVLRGHPQQLLNIDPPQLPDNGGCPRGFLGYAVNLIHLRDEHLQIRIPILGQEVGIRESLFFDVYRQLTVFDTRENVEAFRNILHKSKRGWQFQPTVSLDGGIWRSKARRELGQSSGDVGLLYATVPFEERFEASLFPPTCDSFARMKSRRNLQQEYDQQKAVLDEKVASKREVVELLDKLQEKLALVDEEETKQRRKVAQWEQEMESINQFQRRSGRLTPMEQDIYVLPS